MTAGVLVARLDNNGDVLLAGPAVRAAAATGRPVHVLCGPRGRAAVGLLPGVTGVIEHRAPWIEPEPMPVGRPAADRLVAEVAARGIRTAAILGSSHQSPLPLALLLRWAGVERIAAVSHEHAGALLDHRIPGDPDVHEVERGLMVTDALGWPRPPDDRLQVVLGDARVPEPLADGVPYVVVHPGASVEARTLSPATWRAAVAALVADGRRVVLTGGRGEVGLTTAVAGKHRAVMDLAGRTSLAELGAVIGAAAAVAVGNTGPVHVAAATGTPTVVAFPPTVPLARWGPWRVPHVVLGDQDVPCAGCRSSRCPLPRVACTDRVTGRDVADAVGRLADEGRVAGASGAHRAPGAGGAGAHLTATEVGG